MSASKGRGQVASLPQYAAYLSGEGWAEFPSSVHPVLSSYLNTVARAGVSDEAHAQLVDFLPKLKGTGLYAMGPFVGLRSVGEAIRELCFRSVSPNVQGFFDAALAWLRCPCPVHGDALAARRVAARSDVGAVGDAESFDECVSSAMFLVGLGAIGLADDDELLAAVFELVRDPAVAGELPHWAVRSQWSRCNTLAVVAARFYALAAAKVTEQDGAGPRQGMLWLLIAFERVTSREEPGGLGDTEWAALGEVSAKVAAGRPAVTVTEQMPAWLTQPDADGDLMSVSGLVNTAIGGDRTVLDALRVSADLAQSADHPTNTPLVWKHANSLVGTSFLHEGPAMDVQLGWWCLSRVRDRLPDDERLRRAVDVVSAYVGLDAIQPAELTAIEQEVQSLMSSLFHESVVHTSAQMGAGLGLVTGLTSIVQAAGHVSTHEGNLPAMLAHRDMASDSLTQCVTAAMALLEAGEAGAFFEGMLAQFWQLSSAKVRGQMTPLDWEDAKKRSAAAVAD